MKLAYEAPALESLALSATHEIDVDLDAELDPVVDADVDVEIDLGLGS